MPYKDKAKHREYSRVWMRNHKTGAPSIKYNTLPNFDSMSSWEKCVDEAKSILKIRSQCQFTVAALALRACEIRRGGNKQEQLSAPTLKQFADEIGISNRTLNDWINALGVAKKIKKPVVDYYSCRLTLEEQRKKKHSGKIHRTNVRKYCQ